MEKVGNLHKRASATSHLAGGAEWRRGRRLSRAPSRHAVFRQAAHVDA